MFMSPYHHSIEEKYLECDCVFVCVIYSNASISRNTEGITLSNSSVGDVVGFLMLINQADTHVAIVSKL